jgi:hypothetical protein
MQDGIQQRCVHVWMQAISHRTTQDTPVNGCHGSWGTMFIPPTDKEEAKLTEYNQPQLGPSNFLRGGLEQDKHESDKWIRWCDQVMRESSTASDKQSHCLHYIPAMYFTSSLATR